MADQGFAAHGGWPVILGTLMEGGDLDADTARVAMAEILDGAASPAQIAAFIVALRMKGETVAELGGMVDAMLDASTRVEIDTDRPGDRRGRHRRRPGPHDQREHHLRARRRRRRRAGLQARQPGRVVGLRRRRPARGARRGHRARARRAWRPAWPRPASGSASRPATTRRCATPGRPGATSASPPPSTSSARSRTRAG